MATPSAKAKRQAEDGNPVAAPMLGRLISLSVEEGESMKEGQTLGVMEA